MRGGEKECEEEMSRRRKEGRENIRNEHLNPGDPDISFFFSSSLIQSAKARRQGSCPKWTTGRGRVF